MDAVIATHHQFQPVRKTSAVSTSKSELRLQRRLRKKKAKEAQRLKRENQRASQNQHGQLPQPQSPKQNRSPLQAKTDGQLRLIRAIKTSPQVIVTGPAGTGKSYIPATMAADWLAEGKVKRIILCRPTVSVGKSMGYLPGDQTEKMAPWMVPLLDPLIDRLGKGFVDYAIKVKKIEIAPLETMRGRTFSEAFVIVDEAQNLTLHELKMLVTRVGEGTQLVIDGDVAQTDIMRDTSGLSKLLTIARRHNINCAAVELGLDDIVRSGIVKEWLVAFHKEGGT